MRVEGTKRRRTHRAARKPEQSENDHGRIHRRRLSPRALYGAATLVGAALLAVALVRVTGVGAIHVPDAAAMEVREFRFADRQDGGIDVLDPAPARR